VDMDYYLSNKLVTCTKQGELVLSTCVFFYIYRFWLFINYNVYFMFWSFS